MTEPRPPYSPNIRIGDRIRCTTPDDPFVDHGTEGTVVNLAPPKPNTPARARILFTTDQICIMDATQFEVITPPPVKPQQPMVMAPFPGTAV